MHKIMLGVLSILLVAAVVMVALDQTKLAQLKAENQQLRAKTETAAAMTKEMGRLRKVEVDQKELNRLRDSEKALLSETAKLRARVSSTKETVAESAQLRADLSKMKEAAAAGDGTNQFSGAMGDMVKGIVEQQMMGQVARMKAKLNLTPDQEKAVREILMKQAERGTQAAQKMFSGKMTQDEMSQLAKGAADPEKQIKDLLSPEQLSAYQDYKKDELTSNARLAANAEMLQMQNLVGLTQEQQDKVFPVLYDALMKQMDPELNKKMVQDGNFAARLDDMLQAKLKAMDGILTPEQIESYRKFQETQMKMIQKFMPPATTPPEPPRPIQEVSPPPR